MSSDRARRTKSKQAKAERRARRKNPRRRQQASQSDPVPGSKEWIDQVSESIPAADPDDENDIRNLPLPRLDTIGTTFLEERTDEPGSMMVCVSCGARYYVEGIIGTATNVNGIGEHYMVMPFACPICGGHMLAESQIINFEQGGVAATHPTALPILIRMLLDRVEAGEITPDEALDEMRRTPGLGRAVQWIEDRGATLTLIATILFGVLTLTAQHSSDNGVTPDQIDRIVKTVLDTETGAGDGSTSPPPPTPDIDPDVQHGHDSDEPRHPLQGH